MSSFLFFMSKFHVNFLVFSLLVTCDSIVCLTCQIPRVPCYNYLYLFLVFPDLFWRFCYSLCIVLIDVSLRDYLDAFHLCLVIGSTLVCPIVSILLVYFSPCTPFVLGQIVMRVWLHVILSFLMSPCVPSVFPGFVGFLASEPLTVLDFGFSGSVVGLDCLSGFDPCLPLDCEFSYSTKLCPQCFLVSDSTQYCYRLISVSILANKMAFHWYQ